MTDTYSISNANASENPRSLLKKAQSPAEFRELALSVVDKEQKKVPECMTDGALIASIRHDCASGAWSDSLERDLSARLHWHLQRRRRAAMAHVSISEPVSRRHDYRLVDAIPAISPETFRGEGVTIIRMTTGSGKTERALKPFCDAIAGHGSVGIAAPLVAITHDVSRRCDAEHYSAIQSGEMALGCDRIVTTLQSLDKAALQPAFGQMSYWGFDEATQSIEGLASDKLNNGGISTVGDYHATCHVIQNATHLLLLDAGMNDATIEWIERLRRTAETGERFTIYDGSYQKRDLTARYTHSRYAVPCAIAKAINIIREGGRPIIACEAKDDAATAQSMIAQAVPNAKILTITSDLKGRDQKDFLANADVESLKYDCVIHSPTMTSGVSIEHRDGHHFTHGIVIGGGFSIAPARMFQMMRRVRYLKEWSIFFKPNPVGIDLTEDDTTAKLAAISDATGQAIPAWERFKQYVTDRQSAARADFAAGLIWMLEAEGFTVEMMSGLVDQGFADEVGAIKDAIRDARNLAIMSARDLTAPEAEAIQYDREASQADSMALVAYKIRGALRITGPITETDLEMWDDGRGISRLHRLNDAMGLGVIHDHEGALFPRSLRRELYAWLFDRQDPTAPMGDRAAIELMHRAITQRLLLVAAGILPPKYGRTIFKKGVPQPYPMPKRHHSFVGEIMERMGLDKLRKERNRHPAAGKDENTIHVLPDTLELALAYAARIRGDGPISVNLLKENWANGTISGDMEYDETLTKPEPIASQLEHANDGLHAANDDGCQTAEQGLRDQVNTLLSRFKALPSSGAGEVWLPLSDEHGLQLSMTVPIPDCFLDPLEYLYELPDQPGSYFAVPFPFDVPDVLLDAVRDCPPDRRAFILDEGFGYSVVTVRCTPEALDNARQALAA